MTVGSSQHWYPGGVAGGIHFEPPHLLAELSDECTEAAEECTGTYGLVGQCWRLEWFAGLPRVAACVARGARPPSASRLTTQPSGASASLTESAARTASIIETIERQAAVAPSHLSTLVRGTVAEFGEVVVHPARFAAGRAWQQPARKDVWTPCDPGVVDWKVGFSLTKQRVSMVPASRSVIAYVSEGLGTEREELSTTGCAAHRSWIEAVLGGLMEVVERDALAIWWHARLPATELSEEAVEQTDLVTKVLRDSGARCSLYRIPSDLPLCTVLALLWSEDKEPHAVVGVACRQTERAAVEAAFFESCQVRYSLAGGYRELSHYSEVKTFEDHAGFYAKRSGAELLRRALRPIDVKNVRREVTKGVSAPGERLHLLVSSLGALGLEVIVVDLTTDEIAEAGFCVVRVVVPGAIDIAANPALTRLQGPRLSDACRRLGYSVPLQLRRLPVPLA